MSFNSLKFMVLILSTLLFYYKVKTKELQIYILMISSYIFYSFFNIYLAFFLLSATIVTTLNSYINFIPQVKYKRTLSVITITFLISILCYFKYKGLFIVKLESDVANEKNIINFLMFLPMPVGISFYTFLAISLLIDSFKDPNAIHRQAEQKDISFLKHFRNTIFYISFFPQIISGPITKARDFFPQINKKKFNDIDFIQVTKLLITGYFLKLFVADNLAQLTVALSYRNQWSQMGSDELLAMLFGYSARIYADFAGYSLIAIGIARLFGYKLMNNFNFPYLAKSFSDFWRRWHISLSTWIREYLYFSLGGNRKGNIRTYINLIIAMFVCGLWHGSSLKFAVWGLLHGFALAMERLILSFKRRYFQPLESNKIINRIKIFRPMLIVIQWTLVFSTVSIAWLFFSLNSISDLWPYLRMIIEWHQRHNIIFFGRIIVTYFLVAVIAFYHIRQYSKIFRSTFFQKAEAYILGLMLFLIIVGSGPNNAFIYLQF